MQLETKTVHLLSEQLVVSARYLKSDGDVTFEMVLTHPVIV